MSVAAAWTHDALAHYRDRKVSAGLDIGVNLSRVAELPVGYEWGHIWCTWAWVRHDAAWLRTRELPCAEPRAQRAR
jgi:hypothetical protein